MTIIKQFSTGYYSVNSNHFVLLLWRTLYYVLRLRGNSGQNKSLAQMKEREKCNKNEPLMTSMCQMVLEIAH